jgi:hypothetical protein
VQDQTAATFTFWRRVSAGRRWVASREDGALKALTNEADMAAELDAGERARAAPAQQVETGTPIMSATSRAVMRSARVRPRGEVASPA